MNGMPFTLMSVDFVLDHGPYQPLLDEQLRNLINLSAIHRRTAVHQPVNGCDPVCVGVSEPALLVLAGAWYLAQYSISLETSQKLGL